MDLDELHSPIVNGSQSKPKTGTFDMTLPLPTDLKSAMESPNWDVPMGYKYAVDRECNAWIKQKVLQGTSWDQIKQDLHALNMRLLFTIKTDKKNCFQRAKLRILILGHQYAVKQGEHYFENYSQTVRWPNIRAICAQACINGFTYAKQIDTGAAFLFEANELGTQVLVRVPKELGDILGCGELAFCLKAAYGLPSAPRAFFNFERVRNCIRTVGANSVGLQMLQRTWRQPAHGAGPVFKVQLNRILPLLATRSINHVRSISNNITRNHGRSRTRLRLSGPVLTCPDLSIRVRACPRRFSKGVDRCTTHTRAVPKMNPLAPKRVSIRDARNNSATGQTNETLVLNDSVNAQVLGKPYSTEQRLAYSGHHQSVHIVPLNT